jgi:serine/threonine protein kinase KIN1/2
MLVVDPRERASLSEIMNHPWMTKGFNSPPENFLPQREPLQLPLDPQVIEKMQGFDFGSAAFITEQLTHLLGSEDYQATVRRYYREDVANTPGSGEKKRGMFDFYKRRNSISREGITSPSAEAIRGYDPINAYSPLISIYYHAWRSDTQTDRSPIARGCPHKHICSRNSWGDSYWRSGSASSSYERRG